MPSFGAASTFNSSYQFSYRPVAIFVGGTSGVGRGTAERFAHYTKGDAHIILCGRNKEAAEKIIASFPQHANSKYEFIPCDVSLIKNVVELSNQLKAQLATVNYLVMSQTMASFGGRKDTSEGLEMKMSLHFYSRWKLVDELLPLLQKAADSNQEARVMSVLAPGYGGKVNVQDIGLKTTYSATTAALQVPTYNDLFVEEYAKRHPSISFIHIYPGFVDTPLLKPNKISLVFQPLVKLFAVSATKCGEWMLYALLNSGYKTGNHHIDNHGEPFSSSKIRTTDEAREKLVEHYKQAVAL